MSGRIRIDDAGPGTLAGSEERTQVAPEAPERDEAVAATPIAPDTAEAPERPADAAAEDVGGAPSPESEFSGRDQKRLDQLTRERYEARRERDEARAQLAAWQREQQQRQNPANPNDPYEQGRQQGRQEAQQGRAEEAFNQACNDLWQRGMDEFGTEMNDAKRGLDAVGWGARPDALAALTQLPDGHRVYRQLASNLDNAARILSLPPMAMAMELTRMSEGNPGNIPSLEPRTNRDQRETAAPAPLRPVGGNSTRSERPLGEVSMAEFIRRRDREERGSRIRR